MWMQAHIYSVKAKSQVGNIWVKDIMATKKKTKATRYSDRDLKNLLILSENSAEGLWSKRALLGLCICLWENTRKAATTLLNGSRKVVVGTY